MTSSPLPGKSFGAWAVLLLPIVGVASVAVPDVAAGQGCVMAHEAAPLIDGRLVGLVRTMAVGPDGRLYSAHPFDGSVRVEGSQFWPGAASPAEGAAVRPSILAWLADTLYVTDQSGAYALLLDRRGSVIGQRSFAAPTPRPPYAGTSFSQVLADGRILFVATAPVQSIASGVVSSYPLLAATDGNGAVDTLAWLTRFRTVMRIDVDSVTTTFSGQPFSDDPLFEVSPDGERIVVAARGVDASSADPAYTITTMTAHGDTLLHRRYPYEPLRMREGWKADVAGQLAGRSGLTTGADREKRIDRVREAMYVPAWLPPVSRIVLDRRGSVWVRREAVPGENSIAWDLLAPDGTREGSLRLPTLLSVRAADGLVLWATETVEDRSQRLWRIEVRPC